MDAPTTAQGPSRSSLLQLLRSLFGLPRSTHGTREPRAEGQELGEVGGGSSPGRLAGQQHPCWEPWEGAERESTEPLLGELEGLSLTGSPGSSASRSCLSLSTSDTEVAVAGGVVDTPASSPAQQRGGSGVASKEGTAMPEAFSDKALETDGLFQGLSADGEDVTCSASPELMFSVDFDAEWEKEQLLKADEGAASPKAELSQWNGHRRTSRELQPHAPGSLMELESKEEPLLHAAANRPATGVLPLLPAKPSEVLLGERQRRRNRWLLWEKLGTAGSKWSRNPWKRLRSSSWERWGAAPDRPPRIGSPPRGEIEASSLLPTPVSAGLRPVPNRSSAPAFSSSSPYVSL
ncbi:uncharacterized protein [Ciconia boyciana]|uniref:uncharacterized protein isoform X1 n=1 Tax=Ciconia boyciana TaxID=52775 RepID=UPI003BA18D5D